MHSRFSFARACSGVNFLGGGARRGGFGVELPGTTAGAASVLGVATGGAAGHFCTGPCLVGVAFRLLAFFFLVGRADGSGGGSPVASLLLS